MAEDFFSQPILNSPYKFPGRYWELDGAGQPTNVIRETRRPAEFITPIPKPKKKKAPRQKELELSDGEDFAADAQQYAHTQLINELRQRIELSAGGRALLQGKAEAKHSTLWKPKARCSSESCLI